MKNFEELEFILDNIDLSEIEQTSEPEKKVDSLEKALEFEKELNNKESEILNLSKTEDSSTNLYPIIEQNEHQNTNEIVLEYDIKITPDEQEAYISINYNPQFVINTEFITNILNEEGIKKGILKESIDKLLNDYNNGKDIKNFLIAKGKMPEKGGSAEFIFNFNNDNTLVEKYKNSLIDSIEDEEEKEKVKKELKDAKILCGIVSKGNIIVTKKLPTKGEDGYTVKGKILQGYWGDDKQLRIKRNIKFNEKTNTYIAEIDGEIIVHNDTIWIKRYLNGSFNLVITEDEMKLLLNISPPVGDGLPVSYDEIIKKIEELKIKTDINTEAIKEGLDESTKKNKPVFNILVSEGRMPINGQDGYLKYKIKLASGKKYKIDDKGNIDFKEQDLITLVDKNKLIAVLYKATEGNQDGITVTGKILKPDKGKELIYKAGKNIKEVDYPDRIEFYSQESGHFKIDYDTFNIFPVLKIDEDVDFSVGNIKFNGDVVINGNVNDEFSVIAEGDIIIYGNVGASFIKSDRAIIIRNGILGKNKGKIICKKNLKARFIENGYIECEGNIEIEEASINSIIFSNSNLIVDKGKGQIIGGKIWAGHKIIVNNLGSPTGVKTEVTLGYNFSTKAQLNNINIEKQKYVNSLNKLDEIIKSLFKSTPDIKNFTDKMKKIYTESIRKKAIIVSHLTNLKEKEENLYDNNLIINKNPELIVKEFIYSDVKINYLNKVISITDSYRKIKIVRDKNDIKIISLSVQ